MPTLAEYQNGCFDTAKYPDLGNNPYYPILGIGGESGELLAKIWFAQVLGFGPEAVAAHRELIAKEIGDVWWYWAVLASELQIPIDQIDGGRMHDQDEEVACMDLAVSALEINEFGKKLMRGEPERRDGYIEEIKVRLVTVDRCLRKIADSHCQMNRDEVLLLNLEKCANRKARGKTYGDGDDR